MKILSVCKLYCRKLPIVRKCCFCVPIRTGVIILGYANLVLSLLLLPFLFILVAHVANDPPPENAHRIDPLIHIPLEIVFLVIDVIMNTILVVGVQKKQRTLMLAYFYFGSMFQMMSLFIDLAYYDFREYLENTIYFFFLGLSIYQLFLVYNAVRVIDECSDVQYTAHRDQI